MLKNLALCLSLLVSFTTAAQVKFDATEYQTLVNSVEMVAAADMNSDGKSDLILLSDLFGDGPNPNTLSILVQDANGDFVLDSIYAFPGTVYAHAIETVDLNNDQLDDIVIAYNAHIGIFYQQPGGTLSPLEEYSSGDTPNGLGFGHFNNDNLLDIVVTHWNESYLSIFHGGVNGYTQTNYPKPYFGRDVMDVGDINNDGLDDVVLGFQQGGDMYVFEQNSNHTLDAYFPIEVPGDGFNYLLDLAIADLNSDGLNDVVAVQHYSVNRLAFFYQDQNNFLGDTVTYPSYNNGSSLRVADLNCNGNLEVVIMHGAHSSFTVHSRDANGSYANSKRYIGQNLTHPKPKSFVLNDLDGDNRLDMVFASTQSRLAISKNISIPATFDHIDTTVFVDTLSAVYIEDSLFHVVQTSDTAGNMVYTTIDSFEVFRTYDEYEIQIDSTFERFGTICGEAYDDLIFQDSIETHRDFYSNDTVYISTSYDTSEVMGMLEFNGLSPNLSCYPNPTVGSITVRYELPVETSSKLMLSTIQGTILHEIRFETSKVDTILDLKDLPKGVYLLIVQYENGRSSEKIVLR